LPGGFCSLLLADLGAEVLKVEDTGMGDYIRWAPPYYGDEEQQELGTRSALYLALNRGKRSIRLDLKSEPGARRCCAWSSATTSSSTASARRPRPARRRLRAHARGQPAIVFCAITGYGQDGPTPSAPATT
jgi:crotonobetainyl-CoA:carnitine CoA-transferase CaiB-like acyl-CoA transferase